MEHKQRNYSSIHAKKHLLETNCVCALICARCVSVCTFNLTGSLACALPSFFLFNVFQLCFMQMAAARCFPAHTPPLGLSRGPWTAHASFIQRYLPFQTTDVAQQRKDSPDRHKLHTLTHAYITSANALELVGKHI